MVHGSRGWQACHGLTRPPGCRSSITRPDATELALTLRLVFHLPLRQAEGFARSVLRRLDLDLSVPDHITLSRRGRAFAGQQPRAVRHDGPVPVLLDSPGPQVFGQGEWDA